MAQPPKPADDEGYYKVLTDIQNWIEADGFHDSPPNLLNLVRISKLEAMRLYNAWATFQEQKPSQVKRPKPISNQSGESETR